MEFLIVAALAIGLFMALKSHQTKKRREALMLKYGDASVVDRIMRRSFWQGQTSEQLFDSLGRPVDVDNKVYKTKTKETWKHNQTAKNRFALRITLENDEVVGWDQKKAPSQDGRTPPSASRVRPGRVVEARSREIASASFLKTFERADHTLVKTLNSSCRLARKTVFGAQMDLPA